MMTRSWVKQTFLTAILLLTVCVTTVFGWSVDNAPTDSWTPNTVEELVQLETTTKEISARVINSVVGLKVGLDADSSTKGTGVLISEDGFIATAAHVIGDVPGKSCRIYMADGTQLQGTTLGVNMKLDYGLVKVVPPITGLPYVNFGNTYHIRAGQWVVSVGHPLGFKIQPLRLPSVRVGRVTRAYSDSFTLDAPLVSGDSGGPVFDLKGDLIGINVSIRVDNPRHNTITKTGDMEHHLEELKSNTVFAHERATFDITVRQEVAKAYLKVDRGEFEDARSLLNSLLQVETDHPEPYFHLACVCLREFEVTKVGELVTRALEHLRKAVEYGWIDLIHMAGDPDLNRIRQTQEYRDIVLYLKRKLEVESMFGVRLRSNEVISVIANSPAEVAGLMDGDEILSVDNISSRSAEILARLLTSGRPGDFKSVSIRRGNVVSTKHIRLGGKVEARLVLDRDLYRDGQHVQRLLHEVASEASSATVIIYDDDEQIAQGVIVRSDGYVITKLSEAEKSTKLKVGLYSGRVFGAVLLAKDEPTDLALLKVDARELPVIRFSSTTIVPGQFVMTLRKDGPLLGSLSVTRVNQQPFLRRAVIGAYGKIVQGEPLTKLGYVSGLLVTELDGRAPAHRLGLKLGDVMVQIGDHKIEDMDQYLRFVESLIPNTTIKVRYLRDDELHELDLRVGVNFRRTKWSKSSAAQRLRGPHNERDSDFGWVIQHDNTVEGLDAGSPLIATNGKVIGFLIAKSDRVRAFSLFPMDTQKAVEKMFAAIPDSQTSPADEEEASATETQS